MIYKRKIISEMKCWLDYLYYDIGKQQYNFKLGVGTKSENGVVKFWRNYKKQIGNIETSFPITYMTIAENFEDYYFNNFLLKVNQREILPCEIVLDIEDKGKLSETINKLKPFKIPFYVFSTGSRGFHVHIFFKHEIKNEDKLDIIKYFNADSQVISKEHFIALEFAPHWKSGKIKELIRGQSND